MPYTNLKTVMPNTLDTSSGSGLADIDWRALPNTTQGLIRRVAAIGTNTALSTTSYSGIQYQGLGILIKNPTYVVKDTSNILVPDYDVNDYTGGTSAIITVSGTYTGITYRSTVSGTPAVQVNADDVIFENCVFISAGDCIKTSGYRKITVRNCKGFILNPTNTNSTRGKFINAYQCRKVLVENCWSTNGVGILCQLFSGDGRDGNTITIRNNILRNINGRLSNGNYPNEKSNGIQLTGIQGIANCIIENNHILNEEGLTTVEDNINMHNTRGFADSHIIIRGNCIDGPGGNTGSGFTTDGDKSFQDDPDKAAAYIEVYNNYFLGVSNGSINISGGNNNLAYNNWCVSANENLDGTQRTKYCAGASIFNSTNSPDTSFFNNKVIDNVFAINHPYYHFSVEKRHDIDTSSGNNKMLLPDNCYLKGDKPDGTVSKSFERSFKAQWLQVMSQLGVQLGPLINR